MVAELRKQGVRLRLHSGFSQALVRNGRDEGIVAGSKARCQAMKGAVVIDATADFDVAAAAGARFVHAGLSPRCSGFQPLHVAS